jgi:signal transduction histidine kinase
VVSRLKEKLRSNVLSLERISEQAQLTILSDVDSFDFDPAQIAPQLSGPTLSAGGHGTHFYIHPVDAILDNDIDCGTDDDASNIQKMLLGFSNTMYADSQPVMRTAFRDHDFNGETTELIGGEAFFTPDEFATVDHHIEGAFDEYGQFAGSISTYHRPPKEHTIHWPNGHGVPTDCGPFRIRFAYLQGNASETIVPLDQYGRIFTKTNRIGGVYIYRDGIRILPYGRGDYDFLEIERRRTKSANDWFFSYRRLFGAVEVSCHANPNLIEKAGREGFRENRAYRQFREILMNFFQQLAIDFFRDTSLDTDFTAFKSDLKRQADLLKRRDKLVSQRKRLLALELDRFFSGLEEGRFAEAATRIRQKVDAEISRIQIISDHDVAGRSLIALESEARSQLVALRKNCSLSKPRGIGYGKTLLSDWSAYQKNRAKLEEELIGPLEADIERAISELNETRIGISRRVRISQQLDEDRRLVQRRSTEMKRTVGEQMQLFKSRLDATLQDRIKALNDTVENVLIDFERTNANELGDVALTDLQVGWEASIDGALRETDEYLSALRDQLESLTESLRQGELLDGDTLEAVESRSENYKEQLDQYFEFAQVGMSLGIIQHEFSATVKHIRDCIKALKPWADGTPALEPLYGDIRNGFEHLDGYLSFFTPLNRRLYRRAKALTGHEILRYVQNVFGERLDRHHIALNHTENFDEYSFMAYPSTILPVFVNLIDNAIYWLNSVRDGNRGKEIRLDATERGLVVSNNGPGIDNRDADRIFEFGVTRKPNGRGMGLYISRESLHREGFDLELLAAGGDAQPAFLIAIPEANHPDDNETELSTSGGGN